MKFRKIKLERKKKDSWGLYPPFFSFPAFALVVLNRLFWKIYGFCTKSILISNMSILIYKKGGEDVIIIMNKYPVHIEFGCAWVS